MEKSVSVRFSTLEDKDYLIKWLSESDILRWFPLYTEKEIEDAAKIWISYTKYKAVLTSLWDQKPCGIANLYLQPYKKLSHQSLFAIIVDANYRNKGIGTFLMKELMKLAKEQFHFEYLHLEVYEGNPAFSLYSRLGFQQYGVHPKFLKEPDGTYLGKILMQKKL